MKLNRIVIVLLLFVSAFVHAGNTSATFDSANAAYAKGKYDAAIKLYESILADNRESAALYFNLGNAYFKSNSIGLAILNYERAKKLNPDDEEINENLKLANQRTEDKIEAAPQLFLSAWKNGITDLMTEKQWSLTFIALIFLGLLLIAVYIVSANRFLKQTGFFGGSFLLILSVFVFFLAKNKYNTTINSTSAIITSGAVTVTGSPSEKGTKLFILHEGVKVEVTDEENDWSEIKIVNGNVGWVKTSDLQKI